MGITPDKLADYIIDVGFAIFIVCALFIWLRSMWRR